MVIFLGFPDVGQQALGHGGQRDAATPREQETGQSGINQKLFQINQLTILYIFILLFITKTQRFSKTCSTLSILLSILCQAPI